MFWWKVNPRPNWGMSYGQAGILYALLCAHQCIQHHQQQNQQQRQRDEAENRQHLDWIKGEVDHLLAQKQPSGNYPSGMCMYQFPILSY